MTWREFLKKLREMEEPLRVVDVAKALERPRGEISHRIEALRNWGYLKYAVREKKGYGGFVLTERGREMPLLAPEKKGLLEGKGEEDETSV